MHSLKNTIVAVGLLGLSFVFYQLSEPKNQTEDTAAAELDAMISGENSSVEMPDLSMSAPADNGAEFKPLGLPAPSSFAGDSKADLPAPKNTNPFPTNSQSAGSDSATNVRPRPTAEFEFNGKPDSDMPDAEKNSFGGTDLKPTKNESQQQRDAGLMAALDQQKKSAESGNFEPTQLPAARQSAPMHQASTVRDSAVVGASSTDGGRTSASDFGLPATNSDSNSQLSFRDAWPVVEKMVGQNDFRSALKLLTRFHQDTGLTGPQKQRLEAWLDALAGKVVFSTGHHLFPAYVTTASDSLADLSRQWGVPGQLIYNINKRSIPNPLSIAPGTELKKIVGPVDAVVDLQNGEMTMYVDGLYAGRFATKVGVSGSPRPGDFKVLVKAEQGHEWRDEKGVYPPNDPRNQYGRFWIGLEGQLCLHAIEANKSNGHLGCLGLSEKDAKDLFAILSEGSTVTIR